MFGSNTFTLKLAGAVAVAAVLGVFSSLRGEEIEPEPWKVASAPEKWEGVILHLSEATVTSVKKNAFSVHADGVSLLILGAADVAEGDRVSLSGEVQQPASLRLKELRALPPRWIPEICTAIILILVLLFFWRNFSIHPEALQVKGKQDE